MFEGVLWLVVISAIWIGCFQFVCGTLRVKNCCVWCFKLFFGLLSAIGATYFILLTFKFVLETLGFDVSEDLVWPTVDQPLPDLSKRRSSEL